MPCPRRPRRQPDQLRKQLSREELDSGQPVLDPPVLDPPGWEPPGWEPPGKGQPSMERPGKEQPSMERPGKGQPGMERPVRCLRRRETHRLQVRRHTPGPFLRPDRGPRGDACGAPPWARSRSSEVGCSRCCWQPSSWPGSVSRRGAMPVWTHHVPSPAPCTRTVSAGCRVSIAVAPVRGLAGAVRGECRVSATAREPVPRGGATVLLRGGGATVPLRSVEVTPVVCRGWAASGCPECCTAR